MEKVAENGREVKAFALLYCCFLPLYEKLEKVAENGQKVKTIALLFCCFFAVFCSFVKNGKSR
jgi:hypothetical protein